MIRNLRAWVLAAAWWSAGLSLTDVEGQTPLRYVWGPNQGLAQYSVSSIVQDRHGYIWLGTQAGVSRFNGREFVSFDDRNGFVNGPVRTIVATDNHIYLLSEAGELHQIRGAGAQPVPVGSTVRGLFAPPEGAGGGVWLLVENGLRRGLLEPPEAVPFDWVSLLEDRPTAVAIGDKLALAVGRTIYLADRTVVPLVELSERVADLFTGPDGELLAVTANRLLRVDPAGGPTITVWAADGWELRCGASAHGRTVLGTTSGAIVRIEGGQATVLSRNLPARAVLSVMVDREDNIWAGLDSGGLVLLPNAAFVSYTETDGVGTGDTFYLVADTIRGGVWAGTRNGGIAHITDGGVWTLSEASGLPSNRVRALYQARSGTLFVGTAAGLHVIEPDDRQWSARAPSESLFQVLYEDPWGQVFAGSRSGLLWMQTRPGNRFEPLDSGDLSRSLPVTAMGWHRGTYYLGTTQGLYRLGDDPRRFTAVGPDVPGRIRELRKDGQGRLWVATFDRGAWCLETDGWRNFERGEGFDEQIRFITIAPDGIPWFAGNRGVWRYPDPFGSRINTGRGLASDNVFLLRFDPLGRLWVGHNKGLNLIHEGRVIGHFDHHDGLADSEINANGFAVDEQGRLWFASMRGASRIDPETVDRPTVTPLIHLERLEANDQDVPLPDPDSGRPGGATPVRLTHYRNSLRFHFSGQSFLDPTKIRYSHLLEGYDDNWSRPVNVGWAHYPKLPPGRYHFRVRCISAAGVLSQETGVMVEVIPAWWQRTSFRVLGAALLLGLAFGGLLARNRQTAQRNRELARLVAERTRALAEANDELRRISITDPLTGLYNRRFFEEGIQREMATATRMCRELARPVDLPGKNLFLTVFLLDLDHFKRVNDSLGHEAGDYVLGLFGGVVQVAIRSTDTLFRWGGEEFLLLARHTDPQSSATLAERVRQAVEAHRFEWAGTTIPVTCSIGYVSFPLSLHNSPDVGWSELVRIADQALYLAKQGGRNAHTGVSATSQLTSREDLEAVLADLETAYAAGLVQLTSGRPAGGSP